MTEDDPHRRIDFLYRPCIPVQKSEALPEDKCLMDDYDVTDDEQKNQAYKKKLQENIDYIGSPKLQILVNQESPNLEEFGPEKSIKKESTIFFR